MESYPRRLKMISVVESEPRGSDVDLVRQVEEIFSAKGILSKSPNFEYRRQQQEMAVAVAQALENGKHLAVEAGTGVGKSLAYLVSAILYAVANKKKAVISTHTINLQEQLTQKDLPMLEKILPVKFQFTMLKGRGNYLCTRRLQKAYQQSGNLFTSSEAQELETASNPVLDSVSSPWLPEQSAAGQSFSWLSNPRPSE